MKTKMLLPLAFAALLSPALARAHCDTLDGPVVVAARSALDSGQLNPVLAWVPAAGETEIREAFAKARAARKAGKEAREVADQWFFETVVRVHRASEGAPYTGLKPAGQVEPAVAVVDQAIAKRDPGRSTRSSAARCIAASRLAGASSPPRSRRPMTWPRAAAGSPPTSRSSTGWRQCTPPPPARTRTGTAPRRRRRTRGARGP